MTIIKQGKVPGDRVWRGTCFNCSSVMEALEKELNISTDIREAGMFAHTKCPVCKSNFTMYPHKEGLK